MIEITKEENLWSRCFTVYSLVVIGTREENGDYNLAPKHMAMPLGFGPWFGFMGTSRKTTYRNIQREKAFTVSYPNPDQVVISSLAASRREKDDTKPVIEQIPTEKARTMDGIFIKDSYLQLECSYHQTMGRFGEWELVVGRVEAAYAREDILNPGGAHGQEEAAQTIKSHPLLAYVHPDRFGILEDTYAFPLPKDFER